MKDKIISYTRFEKVLNEKLFENGYGTLISKIVKSPERYIGLFRPTKPQTKLIQNITQSHEIRFGNALEALFEEYFRVLGFDILDKVIKDNNGEIYNIDQLLMKGKYIYLIEQKIRDDHDSTKKRGQFKNFEDKYCIVNKIYKKNKKIIIPIMWFIDCSFDKNKCYFSQEMKKMAKEYGCNVYLFYGEQLFNETIGDIQFSRDMWSEIISYLKRWKEKLPDIPEINFDNEAQKAFEEIKSIKTSDLRSLFDNEEIIKQIFPIIFPQKIVLEKLRFYFLSKNEQIYKTLSEKITRAMQIY